VSDTDDSPPRPSDDNQATAVPKGDTPTLITPLGVAALWKEFLRDPVRHRRALDGLVVKPERWGDYTQAAATMWRLEFTDLPVSVSSRAPEVAYVRFVQDDVEWFLTTVRGADGLWRVWDLTEQRRPPASQIFG
jgi:hypothetical protein